MAQTTMYPITTAGLQTVLTQALSTSDTQLYVQDITVFDNASNLVTIKTNSTSWEVCKYTGKTAVIGNGGYLTIVRSGTEHLSSDAGNAAVAFNAGAKAFRGLTNYDYGALKANITDHEANITDHETRLAAAEGEIDTLQAGAGLPSVVAAIIFG